MDDGQPLWTTVTSVVEAVSTKAIGLTPVHSDTWSRGGPQLATASGSGRRRRNC